MCILAFQQRPCPVLVAPAPYLSCMTSGLSTFLLAVQVSLDESKIECQRLNVCCTQRESDVVTAENSKVSLMSTLDCQNVHSSNNSCKKVCCSRRQMHWSSACCMSSMQRGSPQSCKHWNKMLLWSVIAAFSWFGWPRMPGTFTCSDWPPNSRYVLTHSGVFVS